jgi:uncharacterized membrane protein YgcG
MKSSSLLLCAAVLCLGTTFTHVGIAQDSVSSSPPAQDATDAAPLTPQQLDELVAPVALYDDSLLADILTASTYPVEIVEAQRWTSQPENAALEGDALPATLADLDWDPSVKSLVPFPRVLQMMDNHLEWTQRLGEAFLAQQSGVMDAVQRLRHRAEVSGTLKTSPQEAVASDGDDVTIAPPSSGEIYVPDYDPWCAFGAWTYAPDPALYFVPPDVGDCYANYALDWDEGAYLPFDYWDWGYFDWRHHHLGIRRDRFDRFHSGDAGTSDVWHHNPAHRVGMPYRDPRNVEQFQPDQDYSRKYRGYGESAGEPAETERMPPAFADFGSGRNARMDSDRGFSSRQSGGFTGGFGGRGGGSFGGGRGGSFGRGGR